MSTTDAQPPASRSLCEEPPSKPLAILSRLGPGLIIAASIVGSGELIATTKTGADAGFQLLWLILIGCVIKVFVQVEFGRFAITEGKTSIEGMNLLPGPRWRVNWLVWYWILMFVAQLAQLGGIVGGVGQNLAMCFPISGDFLASLDQDTSLGAATTMDDIYWSLIVTAVTAVMLFNGRYGLVQNVATTLVVGFTAVTMFNLFALPYVSEVRLSWSDFADGLKFHLPPRQPGIDSPLATALAAFGIIGVGASELVAYPYWCLEKGYARFTGPREANGGWVGRAAGWLRVMRWDAVCSLLIYTLATVAFYLLGAAVLHPEGLSPSGNQMIRTLTRMYEHVFGAWGEWVFLFGAFAVLYSTFFVAIAGNARIAADCLRLLRLQAADEREQRWWVRAFCAVFPFLSLAIYSVYKHPVQLVLISGMMQAIALPMLGAAAIYFRYRRSDPRLMPGRLWDVCLWLSMLGLCVAGLGAPLAKLLDLWR
jgi:Mn2+/Fe2+ NRAMP family transporter